MLKTLLSMVGVVIQYSVYFGVGILLNVIFQFLQVEIHLLCK